MNKGVLQKSCVAKLLFSGHVQPPHNAAAQYSTNDGLTQIFHRSRRPFHEQCPPSLHVFLPGQWEVAQRQRYAEVWTLKLNTHRDAHNNLIKRVFPFDA